MVDYIGVERVRELVSRVGPARFMEALATEIEHDYRRWREFEKSPRHATHSAVGVIELMPTSDGRLYSFKYVNGHPKNTAEGLLTVTAFGVLSDVETGYPLLLSEMTFTTALRTAAMSAMAARRMARPDSRVMALIGNGAQSEFQAIAFNHMLGIRELRLYDIDSHATLKLERNLLKLALHGLRIIRCSSPAEAVRGADIITTVTADKCNAVILTPEMIQPGMHINAVGGDCPGKTELHADILRRKDARVIVEYAPQCRIEGEIQQLEPWFPVIELSELLTGTAVARANAAEVTVFDSVGFALTDFSALRYLHRLNREQRATPPVIDLVPDLEDPKDLFGGLTPELETTRQLRRSWSPDLAVTPAVAATRAERPHALDTRARS
jgi:ornithine cyclodeaminase